MEFMNEKKSWPYHEPGMFDDAWPRRLVDSRTLDVGREKGPSTRGPDGNVVSGLLGGGG